MNINLNEVLAWAHHQKHPFTLERLCNGVFDKPALACTISVYKRADGANTRWKTRQ
ncbi:hypothetical protein [Xylella fastidiosa]|uniref:hypothetical protein n=1 Tax=Xylella fastidiosa TaxID=2371 RepID=UPI0034DF213C